MAILTSPYLCPDTLIETTCCSLKSQGSSGTTNGATNPPLAASTWMGQSIFFLINRSLMALTSSYSPVYVVPMMAQIWTMVHVSRCSLFRHLHSPLPLASRQVKDYLLQRCSRLQDSQLLPDQSRTDPWCSRSSALQPRNIWPLSPNRLVLRSS